MRKWLGYSPKDKRQPGTGGVGLEVFLAARAKTVAVHKGQGSISYMERLL